MTRRLRINLDGAVYSVIYDARDDRITVESTTPIRVVDQLHRIARETYRPQGQPIDTTHQFLERT